MAEAIHCPSCSTRYRLRPERLKPVHRRAKCFTCGSLFPVDEAVARLLPLSAPMPLEDAGIRLEDMLENLESPAAAPAQVPEAMPSLTLGDLDGTENEILEKTIVETPSALPEMKEDAPVTDPGTTAADYPPAITETTLSGYTSARDAIDKLFGDAPAQPKGLRIQPTDENPTDLEATLSALDSTLGGTEPTPKFSSGAYQDEVPTVGGTLEEALEAPSTSTMRLSQADILAAMQATPAMPHEERTVAIPAQPSPAAALPPPPAFAPPAGNADAGAELLRLKIGDEIYGGLTMPQLIAWVEEGRILENHLVARQYSENWLDAHKVPGLRPVFERLRRERIGAMSVPESGISDTGAHKKSLFGGLFGKS
ncbi:MAG TPA: zinc-ribbon domain-containing protein [Geothrix sp.]|nr:zinc-ribbon domain-containing protein [Geothrix sp.]